MSRPNLLFRRVVPIALIALLVVMASGCDWAQPSAASVKSGGRSFSVSGSQFTDLIKLGKGETLTNSAGAKTKKVGLTDAAGLLTLRIRYGYFVDEAKRRGLHLTSQDISAAKQAVQQDASAGQIPKHFQTWLATGLAAQNAVANDLVKHADPAKLEQASQALFAQVKDGQSQTCVELLATIDQATATTAATSIKGGTSFKDAGTAAAKTDPQSQASPSAQCLTGSSLASAPAALTSALQSAPVNTVDGPITATNQGQTAYYVLRVTARKAASYDQLKPQLDEEYGRTEAANQQEAFLKKAKVAINPKLGTWDGNALQVTPPAGLPAKFSKLLNEGTTPTTASTSLAGQTNGTGTATP